MQPGWEVVVSNTVPYRDLQKLLLDNGWTFLRMSSSHALWAKVGRADLNLAVHRGQCKHVYYKQTLKAIAGTRESDAKFARRKPIN